MADTPREIKPSLARFFRIFLTTFLGTFVPLMAVAVLWSIYGLGSSLGTAFTNLAIFGGAGLLATGIVTGYVAREISNRLQSVYNLVRQMSSGDFEKRISLTQRNQIEELATLLDQTQQYLATRVAGLESSSNQLRTVLDSMVEGVIAIDREQRVLLLNEAGQRLFQIQDRSPVGRPVWEIVRSPQLASWVSQSLSKSEPVGGELEIKAPLPRILSVRVAGLPGPTISGAIVVASDISQLRRLEQVRQEFVANASHELKTPLASITACVETLLDGALEDAENRVHFLQTINEQTDRLDKLVRDLLALTRIESEDKRPSLHRVELSEIISLCVNRHVSNAERKEMRLITVPPQTPVQVIADEESLEQILDNLIDNAIKYTNSGGTITVRWEVENQACRLQVEDTGIGIPQAHQVRIFERFYRVDRARSRELGGTGLGLSIVKHLVQQMGGTVSVSSWLGKGSVFTVELGAANAEM